MSNTSRSLLAAATTALALSVLFPLAAAAAADHLVIGEVVMKVRDPRTTYGSEFVEIHNPTAAPVDLSDVYLTDAKFTGVGYWQLVQGGGAGLGGSAGDFHARFPEGLVLAAGASLVIALEGSELFETAYGELPDLELYEEDTAADEVPEMREAFPGSIAYGLGSAGTNAPLSDGWLGDTGESLMLYTWDGASDLVQDLDYLLWGTDNSYRVDKTGVTVDGPDADTATSAYLADTAVAAQSALAPHSFLQAFRRSDLDETGEPAAGGNGLTGHDETGEPLASTWIAAASQDPTLLGAGLAPAPILLSVALAAEPVYDGQAASVAISLDSADTPAAPVLHWSADGGVWNDVTATGAGGSWTAAIPAQGQGVVVSWWLEAAGAGGGVAQYPAHAPFYLESYTVEQAPDPGDGPAHLLLTEVCVQGSDHEFIEITNPTDEAVALDDYYLTDAVFNTQGYWLLPAGNPSQSTVGGGDFFDFHGRFPAGMTIQPGESLVVSIAGSEAFSGVWGVQPDIELREDGGSADGIPDMREIFPGSLQGGTDGSNASLTNTAEIVVLYYWDGVSDLVTDVDMFMWGSSTSARVDKTGVTVGSSTYLADTPVASQDQFLSAHDIGGSYQRLDPEEGTETALGGNGPAGHDETSENVSDTWQTAAGTPGTFGAVDLQFSGASITRPTPEGPVTVTGSLSALVAVTDVTLHYSVAGGAWQTTFCSDNGDGTWSGAIPTQPLDTAVEWYLSATGAGGASAAWPADAPTTVLSYTVLEPIDPGDGPAHLLLTEVCVQGSDHEFIEITNPTDAAVALDNFYITDAVYNDQGYWLLPAGNPSQATVGGGDFFDFHGRFPAGMTIQPGESLVVSIAGSEAFSGVWGVQPDIELREDGGSADGIPDMREIFPGSLQGGTDGSNASLTNTAEIVVLYYWDGVSDLVTDVDMFMWGSSTSARVYRNGVSIGSSTYATDTPVASQSQLVDAHDIGGSYVRIDPAEGTEPETGGNGPAGHDETGENVASTWQVTAAGTPGVFGTVDLVFTGASTSATIPGAPVTITGSLTALVSVTGVTLHYAVDGGDAQTVACSDNGDGTWSAAVPEQDVGAVVTWYLSAAGAGGAEAFWPAGAPGTPATYTVEELPDPVPNPPHLLLSEVCVTSNDHEFVEIFNPTDEPVDLSNYYLTDAVHYQQGYWRLPEGNPTQETVGGGAFYDFNARFPAGMILPPGGVATIAITGSEGYTSVWGAEPDIVLINPSGADIPEMRDVFPGSRRGDPVDNAAVATLTNSGEIVVLYYWDQVSNLVKDIDVFTYGTSTGSARLDRAGYSINGQAYAPDTPVASQDIFVLTHAVGESYQRTDVSEGEEPESGGNGTLGHDETGEDLTATWEITTAPNPGVFSEYVASFAFSPAQFEAGVPSTFTLNLADGVNEPTAAAFNYSVDGGAYAAVPLSGGQGVWTGSVPAFSAGQEVSWYVSLEFDGTTVYFPAGGEASAETIEVLAGFSLSVPPRTFLPGLEEFPITITFPRGNEAVLRILDLEGRVVRTLYDTRFETVGAPINRVEFDWDGRNDEYELVKAGTYIVHLQAVEATTGKRENKTAPAVVATRLSR